jgi:hypothetical protein
MGVMASPLNAGEGPGSSARAGFFGSRRIRVVASLGAALALQGCALFGADPELAAAPPADIVERDARIAALEGELQSAKSRNAELERRLAELQKGEKSAAAAPDVARPELKDEPGLAVATAPSATPEIKPESVVAAADAGQALASAPAKPVEAAPRLVQPTFASDEEIFENEAGDAIETASVLFGVHLASYRHEAEARAGWGKLQQDFPDELGLLEPRLERVVIEGRGAFLRLVGGGFANEEKASALCARLRAKSAYCAVAGFAGEKLARPDTALR